MGRRFRRGIRSSLRKKAGMRCSVAADYGLFFCDGYCVRSHRAPVIPLNQNMIKYALLFVVCLSLVSPLNATSERMEPRVPPITAEDAIKLVYEFHKKESSASKPIFVDEAVFVRENNKSRWEIGTRFTEYESGHMIYNVFLNGVVEAGAAIKDR